MQITNTFRNENDDILYKERDVVTHISIFLKGKLVGTEKIGKTRNFMPNTISQKPRNLYEIVSSTEKNGAHPICAFYLMKLLKG